MEGSAVSLTSPDQGVFFTFIPAPNMAEAQEFVEEMRTNFKKSKNYKDGGKAAASQVGALTSSRQSGTFEDEGDGMSWAVEIVKAKSLVVIYSLIQNSFKEKNALEIQALMDSVKTTN